jgi:hypothetical protein
MSRPYEMVFATITNDVTVVTTALTNVVVAPPLKMAHPGQPVMVFAWCQLTTGTATTSVGVDFARNPPIPDVQVGERNNIALSAAAGSTEQFYAFTIGLFAEITNTAFRMRLAQTAATGNGTILQAGILVIAL